MICPKCKSEMEAVSYEGIEVDRCTGCAGLWFDMLEHEMLKTMEGSEAIDTGNPGKGAHYNRIDKIQCPRCGGAMVRMVDAEQPHIWYEKCHACFGVFFDAGEFKDFKKRNWIDTLKSLFIHERK